MHANHHRPVLRHRRVVGWWVVSGWVGRWVGGWVGGDLFPPPIVFIFLYVNKQNVVTPNMVFKVVNGYYFKSYEQFKFEIWKI